MSRPIKTPSPFPVGSADDPGTPSSPRARDGDRITSKGSKAAPIHRVRIDYPGYQFHQRIGVLTGAVEDYFLGTLFCVDVDGCALGLTRGYLLLLKEAA